MLFASWSWPQCVANSFILPALFWITQIFYFILFSYKDQTLCPHVIWHDFLYTKTRFEGLKLLYFSLFATSVWEYFVKKSCKFKNYTKAPKSAANKNQMKSNELYFEVKTPPISYEKSSSRTSKSILLYFLHNYSGKNPNFRFSPFPRTHLIFQTLKYFFLIYLPRRVFQANYQNFRFF